jgi:sterol desaturase/sphingolipid hydroxylase (fatty acid hydroxylase superfamily)
MNGGLTGTGLRRALGLALQDGAGFSLGQALWYLLLAGMAWLAFSVLFRRGFESRKITPRAPTGRQIAREVLYSLRSLLVFGTVTGFTVLAALAGWTRLYARVEERGWGWFAVSLVLMVFMHDTYFYWTHRLLHHPRLFRAVHRLHHLSTSPSPWSAYSFSVLEALVQAGIGPLIVFTLPVHDGAFMLFMGWQIAFNVLGHCGYEIYPRWFLRSRLGAFFNTPTHHSMHHESFQSNYGIYFNLWDRLMGTNHPHYEERFAAVTGHAG